MQLLHILHTTQHMQQHTTYAIITYTTPLFAQLPRWQQVVHFSPCL